VQPDRAPPATRHQLQAGERVHEAEVRSSRVDEDLDRARFFAAAHFWTRRDSGTELTAFTMFTDEFAARGGS
jgi:hypothetical protein